MESRSSGDYFLGTHDEELARLGLQHRVWRPTVLDVWRRAGITVGSRILDVGAGPGYAALDLAEIVGRSGRVVAVERSEQFVRAGQEACKVRGFVNVEFRRLELMSDPLPAGNFDVAWCRWVASFVSSPAVLIEKMAACIRPGGTAIFHEYANYATWQLIPRRKLVDEFVLRVMDSWRTTGGEPDIALALLALPPAHGFVIREAVPRVFFFAPVRQISFGTGHQHF